MRVRFVQIRATAHCDYKSCLVPPPTRMKKCDPSESSTNLHERSHGLEFQHGPASHRFPLSLLLSFTGHWVNRVSSALANAEDLPNIPDAPPPTPQQSVQSVEQPQAPAEAVEIGGGASGEAEDGSGWMRTEKKIGREDLISRCFKHHERSIPGIATNGAIRCYERGDPWPYEPNGACLWPLLCSLLTCGRR